MKEIKEFEAVKETDKSLSELGINNTLYQAYKASRRVDNETIDFNDVIWDKDVEPIVNTCRKYGIKYITISCGVSNLVKLLAMFQLLGCQIGGITQVKARYENFLTGEIEMIPAIIVKM